MILRKPRDYKWPRRMASHQGVTHWLWFAGAQTAYAGQGKRDSRHTFSRSNTLVLRTSTRAKAQRRMWILNKTLEIPGIPSQFQLFYGDSVASVRSAKHSLLLHLRRQPIEEVLPYATKKN